MPCGLMLEVCGTQIRVFCIIKTLIRQSPTSSCLQPAFVVVGGARGGTSAAIYVLVLPSCAASCTRSLETSVTCVSVELDGIVGCSGWKTEGSTFLPCSTQSLGHRVAELEPPTLTPLHQVERVRRLHARVWHKRRTLYWRPV